MSGRKFCYLGDYMHVEEFAVCGSFDCSQSVSYFTVPPRGGVSFFWKSHRQTWMGPKPVHDMAGIRNGRHEYIVMARARPGRPTRHGRAAQPIRAHGPPR